MILQYSALSVAGGGSCSVTNAHPASQGAVGARPRSEMSRRAEPTGTLLVDTYLEVTDRPALRTSASAAFARRPCSPRFSLAGYGSRFKIRVFMQQLEDRAQRRFPHPARSDARSSIISSSVPRSSKPSLRASPRALRKCERNAVRVRENEPRRRMLYTIRGGDRGDEGRSRRWPTSHRDRYEDVEASTVGADLTT